MPELLPPLEPLDPLKPLDGGEELLVGAAPDDEQVGTVIVTSSLADMPHIFTASTRYTYDPPLLTL